MRVIVGAFTGVLLLIGLAGLGLGVAVAIQADTGQGPDPVSELVAALVAGVVPFSLGIAALGAAVITLAIDQSRSDVVAAVRAMNSFPSPGFAREPGERLPDRNASDWR
ncbi:MAG TPA: hypothetical protein VFP84_09640 [Kofleriaceae bacterium]|nr:hypothetical protein [Kofleriaceae bacterium]